MRATRTSEGDDEARLRDVVSRLTDQHEASREEPWRVTDAPEDYIRSQLRGIVGLRMPIARLEAKRKLSQNRPAADRQGVADALARSPHETERIVGALTRRHE